MTEQKIPTKAEVEKAVLSSLDGNEPIERRALISKSIDKHGFSEEDLKDKSCESLSTVLKSLTGVVINEMLAQNKIATDGKLYFISKEQPTATIEAEKVKKRRRHKKKVIETSNSKVYPDTELGKILSEANKKFLEFKSKKIEQLKAETKKAIIQNYEASVKRNVVNAINIAGGEFFEELSMKILLQCYGDSVVKNELTAGPEDDGIDGILTIKDAFGFEEKVYFQSKTKLSERKNVSIKVARELLGVMTADKVTKGIIITNSNFLKNTKTFAAKAQHLALIDANRLFELMCKYSVGIKTVDGILRIDDDEFLTIK